MQATTSLCRAQEVRTWRGRALHCPSSTRTIYTACRPPQRHCWRRQAPLRIVRATAAGDAVTSQQNTADSLDASRKHAQVLEDALAAARAAVQDAQRFQEHIPDLPSARFPTLLDHALAIARRVAKPGALLATCWLIHQASTLHSALGIALQAAGSAAVALAVAAWGYERGGLDLSGAKAGFCVGWATLGTSFAGGLALLAFFLASSKLTAFCEKEKQLDEAHKIGGQRNWLQVVANSAPPAALLLATRLAGARLGPRAVAACHVAVMAYMAGCCGDTWASEIGQLSDERAYLPSGREVRPGVNGGMTILGTAASGVGGLYIGLTVLLARVLVPGRAWGHPAPSTSILATLVLSTLAGLLGSYLDSVFGASLQFTGFNLNSRKVTSDFDNEDVGRIAGIPLLSNSGVNLLSNAVNSLAIAGMAYAWIL